MVFNTKVVPKIGIWNGAFPNDVLVGILPDRSYDRIVLKGDIGIDVDVNVEDRTEASGTL